jgi:hypothetical protein
LWLWSARLAPYDLTVGAAVAKLSRFIEKNPLGYESRCQTDLSIGHGERWRHG